MTGAMPRKKEDISMSNLDLEKALNDLKGAAGLVISLGEGHGLLADNAAAHSIVADAIYKAVEEIEKAIRE